mgnify:CR=1 FL=1
MIDLISEGRVEIEQSFSNLHTAKMSRQNKLEKPVKILVLYNKLIYIPFDDTRNVIQLLDSEYSNTLLWISRVPSKSHRRINNSVRNVRHFHPRIVNTRNTNILYNKTNNYNSIFHEQHQEK